MRYGFVIDQRKCIGCHACTTACKSEHQVPLGVFRTWVKSVEKGSYPNTRRHFLVQRCNHCENAPCVTICPTQALFKRRDGIVDFDRSRCIGCKSCMEACPYEALYIDPATDTAAKCNFCVHRVEVGLQPACVIVCPEQAIISGDLEDPTSKISKLVGRETVQVRKPEKATRPQLFYIGADQTVLNPESTASSVGYMWSQPNTRLHGREEAPPPVAPSYRPLDFSHLPKAESFAVVMNGSPAHPTAPPPRGQTAIPLAVIKPAPVKAAAAGRPAESVAAGLLAQGVDAQVAYNITHERPWGFLVALYLWTKSIGTGAFIMLALALGLGLAADTTLFNTLAPLTGLVFTGLTTFLLVIDLRHPERFHYILLKSNWKSWLVRGAYILMVYSAVLALWFLGRISGLTGLEPVLLWPGVVLAIASAVYSAFLFGQAKGRDFWQSPLLAPHLFIQAGVAGSSILLVLAFAAGSARGALNLLTLVLLFCLLANAAVVGFELFLPHVNSSVNRSVHLLRSGKYGMVFWSWFGLAGTVAPLALLTASLLVDLSPVLGAMAGILALAGLLVYEDLWVKAGQAVPLS